MRVLLLCVAGLAVGCGSVPNSPDGGGGGGGAGEMAGRGGTTGGSGGASGGGGTTGVCTFDATYRYGETGGLVAFEDTITLAPAASYRHTRSPRATTPPDITCAPPLPACNSADAIDVGDIMRDVVDSAVQSALAIAAPPTYGGDPRAYDGTIFQFLREDGRGFLAGPGCTATGTGCIDVPPGIAKLVADLRALDRQQLADTTCAALR